MRIVASTRCLAKPPTGIGHYTAETLRALSRIRGMEVRTFPARWVQPLARLRERSRDRWFEILGQPGAPFSFQRARHSLVSRLERFFLRQHDKPEWFTTKFSDVYLETNHELIQTDLPTVAVAYDLSVIRFPQWHPAERVAHHRAFFESLLRPGRAMALVTISEAVRRELTSLLGIPADKVITGCCAPRANMRPGDPARDRPCLTKLGLKPGYFLHVGTLEPRKNLAMLVRAWSGLGKSVREAHPLVFAGGKGWGDEELQREIRRAPEGIHHLGYVDERLIPALYRGANSLVMPTHYEGYGMPVVEMRATGGAVITSLDPAVREVAGPDTPGVDGQDEDGWRQSMERAASDPAWLQGQRADGPAWAARHTWDRGARAVVEACHIAMGTAEGGGQRTVAA